MHPRIAIALLALLLAPAAAAQTRHDWGNVENLKRGTPILVLLWSGKKMRGQLVSAGDSGLRLEAYVRFSFGAVLRDLRRPDIRKVELVRAGQNLPDPSTWAKRGALAGGVAGLGLGIYGDRTKASPCGGGCWLLDGVEGAGAGYMVGLVASAVDGVGHLFLRNKLVYEDTATHPPRP